MCCPKQFTNSNRHSEVALKLCSFACHSVNFLIKFTVLILVGLIICSFKGVILLNCDVSVKSLSVMKVKFFPFSFNIIPKQGFFPSHPTGLVIGWANYFWNSCSKFDGPTTRSSFLLFQYSYSSSFCIPKYKHEIILIFLSCELLQVVHMAGETFIPTCLGISSSADLLWMVMGISKLNGLDCSSLVRVRAVSSFKHSSEGEPIVLEDNEMPDGKRLIQMLQGSISIEEKCLLGSFVCPEEGHVEYAD